MNTTSKKPQCNLAVEKASTKSGSNPKSPTQSASNSKTQSVINQQMMDKAYYIWAAKSFEEIQQKEKLEKLKELERQTKEIEERIKRRNKCIERIKTCKQLQQLLSSLNKEESLSNDELNNLFSKLLELTNSSTTQRIELKNICEITDNEEFQKMLKEFCISVGVCHAHLEMMETLDKLSQEYQLKLAEYNKYKQKLMAKLELTESLLFQYKLHQPKNDGETMSLSQDNMLDES